MTIERMEHVVIAAPASKAEELVTWLYAQRELHVAQLDAEEAEWRERFRPLAGESGAVEARIAQLGAIVACLGEPRPDHGGFLEDLFPVRLLASPGTVTEAVARMDREQLFPECTALHGELDGAREHQEGLDARLHQLRGVAFLREPIGAVRRLRHTVLRFFVAAPALVGSVLGDERAAGSLAVAVVGSSNGSAVLAVAGPSSVAARVEEISGDYGLVELPLPPVEGIAREEAAAVERALAANAHREQELQSRAQELSSTWARRVALALGYWESERARLAQQGKMVSSRNVVAVRGYVRTARLEWLRRRLGESVPGTAVLSCPPPEGEQPPVSLAWTWFFRPAGLLVRMFGLPRYESFDPTAYLTLSFLVFFGICYSDAVYGLMLVVTAELLRHHFLGQRRLMEFFRLFTYSGVSACLFGVLTGSWAADLPAYFGPGNAAERLRVHLMVLNPLARPILALGIALGIGVLNQFYGIVLRGVRDWRRGDWRSAVYDGGFWLAYLVGLVTFAVAFTEHAPALVGHIALGLVGASAVGLVLTQGRDQQGWGMRIATGTVSLYGIMGSYGTTAYIGDIVSYSRLLALGLTTSIVGMAFNIIAGLVRELPAVGWGLFAVTLVAGHSFNFVISMLTAFVHSARLIFLEFFGRFYEGGGTPFSPFGFASDRIEIQGGGAVGLSPDSLPLVRRDQATGGG